MSAEIRVRPAAPTDVDGLVELAAQRREQYRQYQPRFWRPAGDARQRQREFFNSLLDDDQAVVLVAYSGSSSLRGFAIARTTEAPPVYNPGGRTCIVDDFTVAEPADWLSAGAALLDAVRSWGSDRGAVQLGVVTAHLDEPKRAALRAAHLEVASEWWVGTTTGAATQQNENAHDTKATTDGDANGTMSGTTTPADG